MLIKQCLKKFYSSTKDNYNLIDFEAKELLNNTENSYNNLKDLDFYIDEIYMASAKKSKDIYLVYYRIQKDNASCSKSEIAIKVDVKNYTFSVYPYEFLKKKGYLNLKENDKLILENIRDIEENDFNRFRVDEIKKDDETLMKEILEKYKFDLNYDIEHLYNTLNIEYKRSQFKNIEDFKKFINKNKQLLIKDEIDKFDVNNNEYDTKYIVYGNNNIQYTFNVNSMLDYDLIID